MLAVRRTEEALECWGEDAIYRFDGTILLLSGTPEAGYVVAEQTTEDRLGARRTPGRTRLYEMHSFSRSGVLAVAGETSYGGAGFVGVKAMNAKEYTWILHLHNYNNFLAVTLRDNEVLARSDCFFPNGAMFGLPIEKPSGVIVVPSNTSIGSALAL